MMRRLFSWLGSLQVTVAGLLLLLILTVWGTLYQVEYGLYLAQERFYQSWFFWVAGVVPFPGAQLVMAILFANLVASVGHLALQRRLSWGFVITHLGLLLILMASAITFYLGKSAYLSLAEGEVSNVAISYEDWELAVRPASSAMSRQVMALDAQALKPGRTMPIPGTRWAMRVDEFHRSCEAQQAPAENPPVNGSGFTLLRPMPSNKERALDIPGLVFTLLADGQPQGRYLLWGGDARPTSLPDSSAPLQLVLQRQRLPLPAMIQLIDFRRELHPGSGMAKSYSSQVQIRGGAEHDRKVLISMNKPLRLHGYTFYQSSFSEDPGGHEVSTLAVVRNHGRMIPYVATGMTGAGMLLHFTGMLLARLRRAAPRKEAA